MSCAVLNSEQWFCLSEAHIFLDISKLGFHLLEEKLQENNSSNIWRLPATVVTLDALSLLWYFKGLFWCAVSLSCRIFYSHAPASQKYRHHTLQTLFRSTGAFCHIASCCCHNTPIITLLWNAAPWRTITMSSRQTKQVPSPRSPESLQQPQGCCLGLDSGWRARRCLRAQMKLLCSVIENSTAPTD